MKKPKTVYAVVNHKNEIIKNVNGSLMIFYDLTTAKKYRPIEHKIKRFYIYDGIWG